MIACAAETLLLRAFEFFGTPAYRAPEIVFWEWFAAHEAELFSVVAQDDPVAGALADVLEAVHPDLCYELGPMLGGRREFVISAGGKPQAFGAVERLCRMAPELARWYWAKFRPRRLPLHAVEFGGKCVSADEVHYALVRDRRRVGIILFLASYSDAEEAVYRRIGQLLLDEALGEYAVATQVGLVELQPRASRYFPYALPLRTLSAEFDAFLGGTRQSRAALSS